MTLPKNRFIGGSPDLDEGLIWLGEPEATTARDGCPESFDDEVDTICYELVPARVMDQLRAILAGVSGPSAERLVLGRTVIEKLLAAIS